MKSKYYYDRYGGVGEIDLHLPKTFRVYFDAYCSEYSTYPIQDKLLDLAYVITHGFDVKKIVQEILATHPHVGEMAIYHAIKELTAAANNVDYVPEASDNSLDTDIEIFTEDLMRRYRLPLDGSRLHFLEDNFREVSDQTVFRSNGWEIAAKDIQAYRMYQDDNFVFYPGDAKLIQKYHEVDMESGHIGQIFPGGPCPEPWYGNPMTAKIIILGDMPKYDDFVVRCSNAVLSHEPRWMEAVQLMIKDWMCLAGAPVYAHHEFPQTGVNDCDVYNSVTYRHWIKELRNLAYQLEIEELDLFNQVCVINANAYYSMGGNDPLAVGILPSQYFLRVLVNYLVNNSSFGFRFQAV